MPVVEPTPHARKRAMVRRGTLHSISSDEDSPKNSTVSPPIQKISGSISPLTRSYSLLEKAIEEKSMNVSQSLDEVSEHEKVDSETFQGRPKSYTLPPGLLRKHLTWQEESGEERRGSANSSGSDVEPRRLSSICPPDLSTISEAKETEHSLNDDPAEKDDNVSTPVVKEKKNSSSLDKINDFRDGRQYSIYNKYTNPDLDYELEEYATIAPSMLQEILTWDCAIDQVEKASNGFILSRVS